MNGYRVIESNECAATMRYVGDPFADFDAAKGRALERMGDPARKRRFYCMLVESPDGTRQEITRGTA